MLFNRDVKRISDLVTVAVLRAFAGGICVFGGRKEVPPASRSVQKVCVCVCVVCVTVCVCRKKYRGLLGQLDAA